MKIGGTLFGQAIMYGSSQSYLFLVIESSHAILKVQVESSAYFPNIVEYLSGKVNTGMANFYLFQDHCSSRNSEEDFDGPTTVRPCIIFKLFSSDLPFPSPNIYVIIICLIYAAFILSLRFCGQTCGKWHPGESQRPEIDDAPIFTPTEEVCRQNAMRYAL